MRNPAPIYIHSSPLQVVKAATLESFPHLSAFLNNTVDWERATFMDVPGVDRMRGYKGQMPAPGFREGWRYMDTNGHSARMNMQLK